MSGKTRLGTRSSESRGLGYKQATTAVAVISMALSLWLGCATTQNPPVTEQQGASAAASRPTTHVEIAAAELDATSPIGSDLAVDLPGGHVGIRRSALARVQRAGPHWLLQRLQVRPMLQRGTFVGWRVVSYSGPGTLAEGDVIRSVNGHPIERPEQFIDVWNDMTKRNNLDIELLRSGSTIRYSFPLK